MCSQEKKRTGRGWKKTGSVGEDNAETQLGEPGQQRLTNGRAAEVTKCIEHDLEARKFDNLCFKREGIRSWKGEGGRDAKGFEKKSPR